MDDFADPKLKAEHRHLIETLADETHHPIEEVDKVYSDAYDSLNAQARVKDFIVLLACKKVRNELH